jgi:hypothetical protein
MVEPGKGIGHGGLGPSRHHGSPVAVECVQEIKRGRDEVGRDLALSNQVHDGEKQKWLVRGTMPGDCRITVPTFIGP